MGLLVLANLLQVGIEGVLEPSVDKVSLGVVLKTLLVESSLEVLESQRVVEDVGWIRILVNCQFLHRKGGDASALPSVMARLVTGPAWARPTAAPAKAMLVNFIVERLLIELESDEEL